ncbi:VOC family protein [Streptomyces albus]|uniref:VOC family protein n=1 Tax=Streptomyces albus TaxID=1888 RepID=UPI003701EEE6
MHAVRGIDHVGVTVPDIEAATEFFSHTLGAQTLYDTLPREAGPRSGAETERRLGVPPGTEQLAVRMLRLPHGPGLELFEFRGTGRRDAARPHDVGWQHLACYTEDLSAACAAVREAGGTVLGEPQSLPGPEAGPRNRFVYCRTPWGSTLELLAYPDPQPYEGATSLRRWRP